MKNRGVQESLIDFFGLVVLSFGLGCAVHVQGSGPDFPLFTLDMRLLLPSPFMFIATIYACISKENRLGFSVI